MGKTPRMVESSRVRNRAGCLIPGLVAGGIALLLVIVLIASYNGLVDKEAEVDRVYLYRLLRKYGLKAK